MSEKGRKAKKEREGRKEESKEGNGKIDYYYQRV